MKLCLGPNYAINFLKTKLTKQEQNTENNVAFNKVKNKITFDEDSQSIRDD